MATIKDVAALAGVSISTVSNTLSKKKYVSPEVTERVMKAVDDLGFSLDTTARNMKSRRSMMLGVILPNITRVFYSQVLAGINEIAGKEGYTVALYNSEYDMKKEQRYIDALVRNKADGIILDSLASESDVEYFDKLNTLCQGNKKIHVVSMGRDFSRHGIYSVCWDNVSSAQMAVQSIIDLGCKKIVYMSSFSPRGGQPRYEGYCQALKANGLSIDPSLCIHVDGSSWAGYSATNRLLNDGISFDGIFAGSDQRAIGAIKAIQDHGLRIPEDIKVVGFDNTFVSSLIQPPLTTVNVPKYRLGREATEMILRLQNCEDEGLDFPKEKQISLQLQLVERMSSNPDRRTTWELEGW